MQLPQIRIPNIRPKKKQRLKKGDAMAVTVGMIIAMGIIGVSVLSSFITSVETEPEDDTPVEVVGNRVPAGSAEAASGLCAGSIPLAYVSKYRASENALTTLNPPTTDDPANLATLNATDTIYADLDYPLLEKHLQMDFNEDGDTDDIINPFAAQGGGILFLSEGTTPQPSLPPPSERERLVITLEASTPTNKWENMLDTAPDNTDIWRQWRISANRARACWSLEY